MWPTHCRQQFRPTTLAGEWRVRLLLDSRVLSSFSFVPGEDVPIRGIRRLLPGHLGVYADGLLTATPYFTLREEIDQRLIDRKAATRHIRARCKEAVAKRLNGERNVFLSGGLDSSGVTLWLKEAGVDVEAYSLDFGERSVEKPQGSRSSRETKTPSPMPRSSLRLT
jgi:asparagine synthase (glutamine-hydrolysing)